MPTQATSVREDFVELRVRARLAWNNWADSPESRKIIAEQEMRDQISGAAWDRVVLAILNASPL